MREDDLKLPKTAEKKMIKFIKQDDAIVLPDTPDRSMISHNKTLNNDNDYYQRIDTDNFGSDSSNYK